jgi:hypothetical protein
MKNAKSIIQKVSIAICIVAVVFLAFAVIKLQHTATPPTTDPTTTLDPTTITVTIKNISGETVANDTITFTDEASVFDILKVKYADSIRYEDSAYGAVLYDIAGISTDWATTSTYIAVYVGGEYSMVGISSIVPVDGMQVLLSEEGF